MADPGQVVILNGAPRSGKSSIVAAIQEGFPGVWTNLPTSKNAPGGGARDRAKHHFYTLDMPNSRPGT
jgi:hypothetical protein